MLKPQYLQGFQVVVRHNLSVVFCLYVKVYKAKFYDEQFINVSSANPPNMPKTTKVRTAQSSKITNRIGNSFSASFRLALMISSVLTCRSAAVGCWFKRFDVWLDIGFCFILISLKCKAPSPSKVSGLFVVYEINITKKVIYCKFYITFLLF